MASQVQVLPAKQSSQSAWKWFADFLLKELEPFPGRGWTVARMTTAATLVMLWIMVYRIPGAALGAYYTLLFSRDSAEATLKSVMRAVTAVGVSLLYIIITIRLFLADPFLHFLWVAGTLFIIFFLISALTEYLAGTAFGFLAVTSITGWDFPGRTDVLLANTLWTTLAVVVAALVTWLVEVVARSIHPYDEFTERLVTRIEIVEQALRSLAARRALDESVNRKLDQYATVGTAPLRQLLVRSRKGVEYVGQMSGTVALVGRLADLTVSVCAVRAPLQDDEISLLIESADALGKVRLCLQRGDLRKIADLNISLPTRHDSLFADIKATVARIPEVFAGLRSLAEYQPSAIDVDQPKRLFKDDAFTSPNHVRFALKGTLAALSCYVIYNAVQWRGLSNSVATCMITALSTVGSSRQKQILRVAGAILGGVVLGMTCQVFLLPHMDGIGEFTLLFVAVTAISAWITTSSPRISYAGAQTGFAFYITHLRTFGPQTSLAIARDDVLGILFGLFAMWMTFDRIWVKDTAIDLMQLFVDNLRRVARFDQQVTGDDLRSHIERIRAERSIVHNNFEQIRNMADSLIFEFGAGWQAKRVLRDHIRKWQPLLRTYFLLEIALMHYRLDAGRGRLEEGVEATASRSRQILLNLAELKDPRKSRELGGSDDLDSLLLSSGGSQSRDKFLIHDSDNQPGRISLSMLEIATSLAQEMR